MKSQRLLDAQSISSIPGLSARPACCPGMWVCEGVLIVFIASIEACEILFNQEGERPEGSQANILGDSDLVRYAPHICLISR